MKFTKSILSKRPAPAVESEVIDQAKIDQLAAQNADKDEVATGGEGIQSAEQQPDTTKDITMAEVDEVIAGETNPIKDDGANKDAGNGTSDEVADDKGVSEVEPTESKDESGTAPTEGKPDPEAEETEAVATGEETAASNEDAAAAVAAELNAEPTAEEAEEAAAEQEEAANAEEEASTQEEQNAEEEAAAAAADVEAGEPAEAEAEASTDDAEAAATDEAAAQEAEIDAAADQAAADAASDVAADPVEPAAVEVEPSADGETTGADEVPAPAGEVTEQPAEEPAAVIVEQPSEEPVGETEIVVATGDAVDGVQQTEEAAVVTEPVEVPVAVTEPTEAAPDFVAVAEATDGVVPAATEVDEAFTAADVVEAELEAEAPTYEVLSDAVQTYPEVVAVLDNAMQNGGISVEAAALLNIFTQRDGIPADMNVATESYGGYARSQTRVAIESIKDSLRQWWADLVKWLKEQRAALNKWLASLFTGTEALRKEAEALVQKAEAVESDKEGAISINGVEFLSRGEAISTDLSRDITELADLVNRAYVPLSVANMDGCGRAGDIIAQLKGDEESATVASGIAKVFESVDSAFRSKLNEPGEDDKYRQSKVQLGGFILRGKVGDNSEEPSLADFSTGEACLVFTRASEPFNGEVKALTRSEIIDTAKAVIKLIDAIDDIKKLDAPCKEASTKIDAAGEHLVKLGEGDNVASQLMSDLRKVVLGLERETTTPFTASTKYLAAVARAAVAAAKASLPDAAAPAATEEKAEA